MHLNHRDKIRAYKGVAVLIFVMFLSQYDMTNVTAQVPVHLRLNHLTQEDGLSQSSGFQILQDQEGYMWFGTQNGLNRYNGYEITVFLHDPQDSTSLSGSHITSLYEDRAGDLWVGTSGSGLNLFDRESETFSRFRIDNPDEQVVINSQAIADIFEDSSGRLWVGSLAGVRIFDREQKEYTQTFMAGDAPSSISSNDVKVIYEDKRNNLWISTTDGLNLWDEETESFTHFRHDPSDPNSISHNYVSAIYEDNRGNLWFGTSGGGLNLYDRDENIFYRFQHDESDPNSISGNTIFSIFEDSRGVLWIGTEGRGLNIYDRDQDLFNHYTSNVSDPQSLTHNSIYVLYESRDNILWIGAFTGGISYIDRNPVGIEHYNHDPFVPNPLTNNSVVSFLEMEQGTFLVGTDGGGLNIFDRTTHDFLPYRHDPDNPETLSSDVILALHQDVEGRLWIGYYNGGITMYNPGTGETRHYRHDPEDPNSLSNDHVYVIYEDDEGAMYFGTNGGGINKLEPGSDQFLHFGIDSTPAVAPVIRAITEDSSGNFWVGTYGGGAIIMDKEDGSVIQQFREGATGLISNVIMSIHEDQKGDLWFGTFEGGIHKFDPGTRTFTNWSVDDGLPNPVVLGILEDDHNNLWLSTLEGLSKFNPSDDSFRNFKSEHGIQDPEFNPLAFYKDRDGFMYFGGINGFNRFHPDSIKLNTSVPPVVLSGFKIFNSSVPISEDSPLQKHISQTDQITVGYDASVLTFDYVTLNYHENKSDQFAYMLEGFDSDWNYVEEQRSATYTNLDPGEYTFMVKAANSDGVWGEDVGSIGLIITPPFWQTLWFYLLSALVIAGLVTFVYQRRVRNITWQNKRLESEVAAQTAELFDKNKELEKTLNELKKTRGELVEKAHKAGMADLATNVLHNVGNILNSVNVSVSLISEVLINSKLKKLKEANAILRDHYDDLENFILNDPKGKALLQYYLKLEEPLDKEYEELKTQKNRLSDNIQLIVDVVDSQQSYSRAVGIFEHVSLEKIVNDTLTLQSGSIERHGMDIHSDFRDTEKVEVEKSKLIHLLVNILKNAKEAMSDLDPGNKKLVLKTWQDEHSVYLSVTDNGIGIRKEHIGKIFNHGFTTRKKGFGFGLHSCANYMQEFGGEINVTSDGPGTGATFILRFPKLSEAMGKQNRSGKSREVIDID